MYESPIVLNYSEPIIERIRNEQEEYIIRGIIECGISIDKDELVKALKYDRGQYDKGYDIGYREGYRTLKNELEAEEYKHSILIHEIKKIMRDLLICPDGPNKVRPVKNTSKNECYKALYKIQELLGTRKFFGDDTLIEQFISEDAFNNLWEMEQEEQI